MSANDARSVAIIPTRAKISFIRQALERERRMRDRVLKGENRIKGMQEMTMCLEFLKDIETTINPG